MSSSPSTLSPASSNSLPSISRPQNLKLPQSHSLNTFPNMNNKETMMEAEDLSRLIFFFDVMSTQEKIAKVSHNCTIVVLRVCCKKNLPTKKVTYYDFNPV